MKSKIVRNEVRFENRDGYLYAHITGQGEDLETTRATWSRVASETKARGQTKLLIHEEIVGELPFMEQFAFADGLGKLGFEGVTVAFVDSRPEQFMNNKFVEDVAVNRGAHGRICVSVTEAEAWLKGQ